MVLVIALAVVVGVSVGVSVAWAIVRSRRRWHRLFSVASLLDGTVALSIDDLRAGRLPPAGPYGVPQRILVQAIAMPGPQGPFEAPLSRRACVWFRSIVSVIPAGYDVGPAPQGGIAPGPDMLSSAPAPSFGFPPRAPDESFSPTAIVLADVNNRASTVVIDAAGGVDTTVMTVASYRPANSRADGDWRCEWIVAPQTPLTVIGVPMLTNLGWTLVGAGGQPLWVSTRTPDELRAVGENMGRRLGPARRVTRY